MPSVRNTYLETYTTCPWSAALTILCHVGEENGLRPEQIGADWTPETRADVLHDLALYMPADVAERWVARAETAGGLRPDLIPHYLTERGTEFHKFAAAYGRHCLEHGVASDWQAGRSLAEGYCYVDGERNGTLAKMMESFIETWEFDGESAVYNEGDVFESRWTVDLLGETGPMQFFWTPDYVQLTKDRRRLTITDYKSSVTPRAYFPRKPAPQLLRYAMAFQRMFPTIESAQLRMCWVNPQNPAHGEDHVWEIQGDFDTRCVTGVVDAMRTDTEWDEKPGCWLCAFCDWKMACPAAGRIDEIIATRPETAQAAWRAQQAVSGVREQINAKATALRQMLRAHVKAHGPLVLPETSSNGSPMVYGAKEQTKVEVDNILDFLRAVQERGLDLGAVLKAENATSRYPKIVEAAEHHLEKGKLLVLLEVVVRDTAADYIMGVDDPFRSDTKPIPGVTVTKKPEWSVFPLDDDEPTSSETPDAPAPKPKPSPLPTSELSYECPCGAHLTPGWMLGTTQCWQCGEELPEPVAELFASEMPPPPQQSASFDDATPLPQRTAERLGRAKERKAQRLPRRAPETESETEGKYKDLL